MRRMRTIGWLAAVTLLALGRLAWAQEPRALANEFYAMDTGTDATRLSAEQQAAMVKELGFDGMDIIYRGLPKAQEMLAAVDRHGIKLYGVYFQVRLTPDGSADLSQLEPLCEALTGRTTLIMMPLYAEHLKPGAPEGEAVALATLRAAAEIAEKHGLRVAIYPHVGAYAERVEFAAHLAKKADRKNLGMMFNLCHYLKTDGTALDARIDEAMPVLFAVTVCGADQDGAARPNWSRLIMTLDQGDYDVAAFVGRFLERGYKGPIGLQHFGIQGDARENLRRSMEGWKKVSAQAAHQRTH